MTNIIQCQRCKSEEHIAFACPKFTDFLPRCAKCGGGHKTDDYGFKCYFCLGMGHTKDRCWKKNGKGPSACENFLKMLVNDKEATLIKLNQLSWVKHNFSLELKCQNARCMYKHPHLEQRHIKYMKKKIENLDTLKQMETSNPRHCHILLKGRSL